MSIEAKVQLRDEEGVLLSLTDGVLMRVPSAFVPDDWTAGKTVWVTFSSEKPVSPTAADILNEVLRTDEASKLA